MQVSDGCGIIFNPLFVKKNGYGTKAQRQYTITQCNTHTHTNIFNETTIWTFLFEDKN